MAKPTRESPRSTFRKARSKTVLAGLLIFTSLAVGCGPKYTYPADKVPESIEKLCRKDYDLEIRAGIVGTTVGALMVVDSLLDKEGQIPKELNEKMGKVMQVVTRVALSTDLPLDYCLVVIRDKTQPYQLMITRSLDDTKRAYADVIGIEESINRTLFGQDKYELVDDSQPPFVIEEVKQENFLTEQIVQRIRVNYTKDAKDDLEKALVMVDGHFESSTGKRIFRFSLIALRGDESHQALLGIFKTVNQVLAGYQFTGFDSVEIHDYLNRQKLDIDRDSLLEYQQKKITDEEILDRFLSESKSIQEAFKLFGFTLPQTPADNPEASVAKAAP